jgi:hypothetical protein
VPVTTRSVNLPVDGVVSPIFILSILPTTVPEVIDIFSVFDIAIDALPYNNWIDPVLDTVILLPFKLTLKVAAPLVLRNDAAPSTFNEVSVPTVVKLLVVIPVAKLVGVNRVTPFDLILPVKSTLPAVSVEKPGLLNPVSDLNVLKLTAIFLSSFYI